MQPPPFFPTLHIYKGSASGSLWHFCESGDTPSSDSECFSSQNQGTEHRGPSCRKRLSLARLPPGIYPLPSDKWRGNTDFQWDLWPRQNVKQTKSILQLLPQQNPSPRDPKLEGELWKECSIVDKTLVRKMGSGSRSATALLCDLLENHCDPQMVSSFVVKLGCAPCLLGFLQLRSYRIFHFSDDRFFLIYHWDRVKYGIAFFTLSSPI